ncbi:MAG TPA: hypothetical protein VGN12_03700 [Pirellulales bacterium]
MLLAARQHPKQDAKGNMVLRYGWHLRAFGFATGLLIPGILAILFVAAPVRTVSDYVLMSLILAFFGIGGGYYFIESMALRITVSPEGIESISPWRKPRFIRWTDIQEIVYSKSNGLVIVIGALGEKIRVSLAVIGIRDFLQEIQSRVPESRCGKASEVLQWFPRQDAKPL